MKVLLHQRQRWIVFLEIASAIAANPMPQNQVLRAGRRADRVELHEAEHPHCGFEIADRKKRARNRVIAELFHGNAGNAPAHAARSASTILSRAARAAGRNPPTNPMPSANTNAARTMPGVSTKRKASSAKVWKFIVEIDSACMNDAHTTPITPPMSPSSNDSTRNATRIAAREKPSARSVPISLVRLATLAYMVIMAPMMAPMEKMTEMVVPR